jgi:hypothetical protein
VNEGATNEKFKTVESGKIVSLHLCFQNNESNAKQ